MFSCETAGRLLDSAFQTRVSEFWKAYPFGVAITLTPDIVLSVLIALAVLRPIAGTVYA